jgi:radical SAM protein with 4Fe4S-binding SPASM domain
MVLLAKAAGYVAISAARTRDDHHIISDSADSDLLARIRSGKISRLVFLRGVAMQDMPGFLQIEPVGQCNLKCQMCPIQFRTDGEKGALAFMDFDDFRNLIEQFPEISELHLQGLGEPMMHPKFFDMVEFAAGRGIRVTTNSNLTLFTRRRAERCVTSGLETLHVSVDGATKETYELVRVGSDFDKVVSNIRLLKEMKAELLSDRPHLRIVFVLMRLNLHELPGLVRLASSLNVQEIFAQHLCHDFKESTLPEKYHPMRDFVDEQTLFNESEERIGLFFDEARDVAREAGVDLRLPSPRPTDRALASRGRERCDWPYRGMYFSYDGQAMPCCMIGTPDRFNFGNAFKTGARDLWTGPAYEEFRRRLESDDPPEICSSCAVYHGTF